jgi:hypothetical protein
MEKLELLKALSLLVEGLVAEMGVKGDKLVEDPSCRVASW